MNAALLLALLAEPLSIVAVPIIVDGPADAATEVASAVDDAVAFRPALRLIRLEEAFARASTAIRVEDCAAEVACLATWLRSARADLGLFVLVSAARGAISVELIEADGDRSVGRRSDAGPITSLAAVVRAGARALLDEAGHRTHGRLRLVVSPEDAEVTVGELAFAPVDSVIDQLLAPGAYALTVRAPSFEVRALEVVIREAQTTTLEVHLDAERGLSSPWLWIGAAAVVVGGAVALAVALSGNTVGLCVDVSPDRCGP